MLKKLVVRKSGTWCGNRTTALCCTYIIDKGEHCQPVWLISGFREALVLVRVVMDNMELKDKMEMQNRLSAK